MSPEEKELLEKSVALAEDNNKILHAMRRSMLWARGMTFLYWALIIGSLLWTYLYIQPYLNKVIDLYNSISATEQKISSPFMNLFKK
jgi:hypothetical protein